MPWAHGNELTALLRFWNEKGRAEVLLDLPPRCEGRELTPPVRELGAPTADCDGVTELEERAGAGRRVLVDLVGAQLLRIPDTRTVEIAALTDGPDGEWHVSDKGEALLRHDRPEAAIKWCSGRVSVVDWPDSRFRLTERIRCDVPPITCADGRGPAAVREGAEEARLDDEERGRRCGAAAAVVSRHVDSLKEGEVRYAVGVTLPKGCTGQQAEALGGWMQLALARLSSTARGRRVVWVLFDSLMVLALIAAVWGSPLKAVYREMAPWVRPYTTILDGWVVDLWVVRMTSHSLPEWQQEADLAASRDWPRCRLWRRSELRVEVRGLKDRNSHLHRKVVHRCVQQCLVERAATMGGVSSWLFRDPKGDDGRGLRGGQEETPRAG
eukprot:gene6311-2272_t